MAFRDSIKELAPPWLQKKVGGGLLYAIGTMLDQLSQWQAEGIKARFPGLGSPEALYLSGRDRLIARGPSESATSYAARLRKFADTWQTAGAAPTLLQQLYAWFSPSTLTPLRLVSNAGVWHTINLSTQEVTKIVSSPSNWEWDPYSTIANPTAPRWWRGWVIIDSSVAPWTADGLWGSPGQWGDGGTWGSDASLEEVQQIRAIVAQWKPAHVTCVNIIITFDASLFEATDTAPPNPNGNYDREVNRVSVNAIFWGKVS